MKGRLDRLKDDRKLRLQNLFNKFGNVGQAYQFIDQNWKMFRRPVSGPIGECVPSWCPRVRDPFLPGRVAPDPRTFPPTDAVIIFSPPARRKPPRSSRRTS